MVDKRIIEQVLAEQKLELKNISLKSLTSRPEEGLVDTDSDMAQVVTGVRRCGKSTLCYNVLRKNPELFAYVNFDDERFEEMTSKELNSVLEVLHKIYGDFKLLFLDEIQNVKSWHLFINRILRQGIRVILTGSNAKLLSGELASHLTGRHEKIELFPFSFADYCRFKAVDMDSPTTKAEAFRRRAFDEYLQQGGFPELLHKKNKKGYVNNLVNNILKRDIEQRHRIKYVRAFESLANHLLNISPAVVVEKQLAKLFGFKSHHTVENYISYLKEAYLLLSISRYSSKSKLRVRADKVYPIDVALMDGREDAMVGENLGWRLETVVLIELLRRNKAIGRDIYYFKNADGYEADFVVCKGTKVEEIYQVCYDLSKEKIRAREIRGLLSASKQTNCGNLFLITDTERDEIEMEGRQIKIIPAYHWLIA